jgi:HSP20 family protein
MLTTFYATDVRQTLDQFRRSVDEMFENFYGHQAAAPNAGIQSRERTSTFSPVLESAWNENFLNVRAVLPGVSETDVRVTVQNNQLILEGERKVPEGFEKNAYRQLAYGKFHTAVALPAGLDVERVQCRLQNGILDIRVPVSEASKPKQIQIQTVGDQKSIGA